MFGDHFDHPSECPSPWVVAIKKMQDTTAAISGGDKERSPETHCRCSGAAALLDGAKGQIAFTCAIDQVPTGGDRN